MTTIDADCHVIEPDQAWEYFDEGEARYQPLTLSAKNGRKFLAIDGRIRGGTTDQDDRGRNVPGKREAREDMAGFARTTEAMRTMQDIEGRLRHMDELGVDIQVLYPTTMALGELTRKPDVDVAMSRSYNRWMADVWRQGGGRLRWIAVPGVLNMECALDQVRWSVDHGACGLMLRGFERDRLVSNPYFFPLYELAQELNVPVTVHAGNATLSYETLVAGSAWNSAKVPVLSAFHHVLYDGLPDRFPRLRWGFIEAAAGWLPYMITDLRRRLVRDGRPPMKERPLADNRVYVACQTNDDLPYVINCVGEDNLVIGSDYGHSDTSSELEALQTLQETTSLPERVVHKILEDNPKALYGL
jgi:predicted TIM-barrel fold metal-dependent hydrolase